MARNYHGEDCLVAVADNSFFLSDQNNQLRNDGRMKPAWFDFPKGVFLASSRNFKLAEMETYLVHAKVSNPANPKVYFDLTFGDQPAGRITMELYADVTPKTAENFRCLCTGEKGNTEQGTPLHYKGSKIDKIYHSFAHGG